MLRPLNAGAPSGCPGRPIMPKPALLVGMQIRSRYKHSDFRQAHGKIIMPLYLLSFVTVQCLDNNNVKNAKSEKVFLFHLFRKLLVPTYILLTFMAEQYHGGILDWSLDTLDSEAAGSNSGVDKQKGFRDSKQIKYYTYLLLTFINDQDI